MKTFKSNCSLSLPWSKHWRIRSRHWSHKNKLDANVCSFLPGFSHEREWREVSFASKFNPTSKLLYTAKMHYLRNPSEIDTVTFATLIFLVFFCFSGINPSSFFFFNCLFDRGKSEQGKQQSPPNLSCESHSTIGHVKSRITTIYALKCTL